MGAPFYDTDKQSLSVLKDSIREKKCPCCHATGSPLSAYLIITVTSFLLFTFSRKEIIVGCANCIISSARKANIRSFLLGWWGLPLGPISTMFALMHNWDVFDSYTFEEPDEELIEYLEEISSKESSKQPLFLNKILRAFRLSPQPSGDYGLLLQNETEIKGPIKEKHRDQVYT